MSFLIGEKQKFLQKLECSDRKTLRGWKYLQSRYLGRGSRALISDPAQAQTCNSSIWELHNRQWEIVIGGVEVACATVLPHSLKVSLI